MLIILCPLLLTAAKLDWQSSPAVGVKRKRLELVGKYTPRLTTLVKFLPGSSFERHGHNGGEEFLVLSGVLSDANGDYGKEYYVRNPPGSFHAPFTETACTILVKLRQFQSMDQKQVVVNAMADTTRWSSTGMPGVSQLKLHHLLKEQVTLYRIYAQCWITHKLYTEGVEIFIYEGAISVHCVSYPEGTWLRYPAGSKFKIKSAEGTCIYLKQSVFPVT